MFSHINRVWLCSILLMALCILAWWLQPRNSIATAKPIKLEQVFPQHFGDWKIDTTVVPLEVSPELKAKVASTYDQTLSRTYIDAQGYRIMLSVAYGGNQSSDSTQVHRPEFCYSAQGFTISNGHNDTISIDGHMLPIRRLLAINGARIEPISYWVTVGNEATQPGLGRKILQLRYGLSGKVPDGLLVRVSSIDDNPEAYKKQNQFIIELAASMEKAEARRVFGRGTE